jgi:hypothetical protein
MAARTPEKNGADTAPRTPDVGDPFDAQQVVHGVGQGLEGRFSFRCHALSFDSLLDAAKILPGGMMAPP